MIEEKFYHRYRGENRQRHLRKSRVDMTSLSLALCGRETERGREKRERGTKASRLYKEEPLGERQPNLWDRVFRVKGAVML